MAENMDNKTLTEILKRLDRLDAIENKLDTLEYKINETIKLQSKRIESLENNVSENNERITELEKSFEFHSKTVDKLCAEMIVKDGEIKSLKESNDQLSVQVRQERLSRNVESQHYRSDHYVKLAGIPIQPGEESSTDTAVSNKASLAVIKKVTEFCGFTDFELSQIDVCHRVGNNILSPIIIKFANKRDRFNFYRQKNKMRNLKCEKLGMGPTSEQSAILKSGGIRSDRGRGAKNNRGHDGRIKNGARFNTHADGSLNLPYVSIFEHLTKTNNDLLKEARAAANSANFKYKGYTIGGEVRVKLSDGATHISIRDYSDLSKII